MYMIYFLFNERANDKIILKEIILKEKEIKHIFCMSSFTRYFETNAIADQLPQQIK